MISLEIDSLTNTNVSFKSQNLLKKKNKVTKVIQVILLMNYKKKVIHKTLLNIILILILKSLFLILQN